MTRTAYVYTPVERASRRLGLFLLILLGLGLTMGLFFVKTRAQDARADVDRLEREIEEHQTAITVLAAEQAVLSSPHRLRRLSSDTLALGPVRIETTHSLSELTENAGEGQP